MIVLQKKELLNFANRQYFTKFLSGCQGSFGFIFYGAFSRGIMQKSALFFLKNKVWKLTKNKPLQLVSLWSFWRESDPRPPHYQLKIKLIKLVPYLSKLPNISNKNIPIKIFTIKQNRNLTPIDTYKGVFCYFYRSKTT